jgi:hypothetical protein
MKTKDIFVNVKFKMKYYVFPKKIWEKTNPPPTIAILIWSWIANKCAHCFSYLVSRLGVELHTADPL